MYNLIIVSSQTKLTTFNSKVTLMAVVSLSLAAQTSKLQL